jgi:hypothetical protein
MLRHDRKRMGLSGTHPLLISKRVVDVLELLHAVHVQRYHLALIELGFQGNPVRKKVGQARLEPALGRISTPPMSQV